MLKETGRTHHSTIAPGKPIKKGYKLFAIGDKSYLYNFAFYSPVQGLEGRPKIKDLEDTSAIIFKLATDTLPPDSILFINNYFTEPKLARALKAVRIAMCETMKPGRTDLPKLLMEMKQQFAKDIPYGVLATVIQDDILMVAWQDNNLVLALTTAYGVRDVDDTITKKRKRPSRTSTNNRIVLPAFKEDGKDVWQKEFNVPKIFFYYNLYMREIDRFNALMAAYSSQRACNRNWMPGLHWLLDGSLSNTFKLCDPIGMFHNEHQKFLEDVVVELLKEGGDSYRDLPPLPSLATKPKPLRGNHEWQDLKSIRMCFQCRKNNRKRTFGTIISGNSVAAPRTRGGCAVCKVHLCRKGDCVTRFHTVEDTTEAIEQV